MSTSGHPADVPVRILGGELGGAVDVVSLAISSSLEVMDPIPDDDVDEDDDDADIEFCPVGDSQLRTTSELALPTPADMESVLDRVSPLKTMDKEAPDSPSSRRDSLASNKSGKSRMVKGPGQGGSKS